MPNCAPMKVMTEFCGELQSREMSSAKNKGLSELLQGIGSSVQQKRITRKKLQGAFAGKSHHWPKEEKRDWLE